MAFNPKLRINLIDVFNRVYNDKPHEVRKKLRQIVHQGDFKDDFGLAAIDVITERTMEGKDRFGDRFSPYSKSYKDSFTFEVYGKGSRVDLKLSGEMLASMQVKASGDSITINFVDDLNAAKAHGHITGMSGRKGGVVRDFFGLTQDEENSIMKDLIGQYANGDSLDARGRDLMREALA